MKRMAVEEGYPTHLGLDGVETPNSTAGLSVGAGGPAAEGAAAVRRPARVLLDRVRRHGHPAGPVPVGRRAEPRGDEAVLGRGEMMIGYPKPTKQAKPLPVPEGVFWDPPKQCRSCKADIWWWKNPKTGKWVPVNADSTSHFTIMPAGAVMEQAGRHGTPRGRMNELALFAGAGGGILGGHLLGWRTVCAVEIDAYCHKRTCSPDRMTAFSRLSRFGMTFAPLTEDRGEELLTWYLAGFHVRTSSRQERERESTEERSGFGEKWRGLLAKYDRDIVLRGELPTTHFSGAWNRSRGPGRDGVRCGMGSVGSASCRSSAHARANLDTCVPHRREIRESPEELEPIEGGESGE